ncbi:MAG TPA: hypothetical protein VGU20_18365 [Stellaceae bacterium]|nr:hypothetical protein [Stellaceae bacterium]
MTQVNAKGSDSLQVDAIPKSRRRRASMRSILIASPIIIFAFTAAAAAQTIPNVPNLPTGEKPAATAPSAIPSGTSIPGAGQTSNPIDKAKTEAECKIPTNATKRECIELMLKK